ncbi:hypothetical protein MKK67_23740 [Methylobacterium sp. J-072]|uniref:hypothetical protein n=1 Tax=Methylobacterium sp. J-072 TaxID=2836651 RepID=UPI001FBC0AB0|nr:hypothetical protein [Methylobacterium sp. J-072]MCJ2095487.1 hypothetical protein [Methylobacterium sp. J-072]
MSLREKGGTLGCDPRVATAAVAGRGPMRETPKGIRIPIARLADVICVLEEARRLAEKL